MTRKTIGECWCCGAPAREKHHLAPVRCGESDADENLVPLCRLCHNLVDRTQLKDWPVQGALSGISESIQTQWGRLFLLKLISVSFTRTLTDPTEPSEMMLGLADSILMDVKSSEALREVQSS